MDCKGRAMRPALDVTKFDFARIVIVKPSSLGDIVHALPTAAALRRRFPKAHMAWVVKREWAEVLEGNPDLNEILPVDLTTRRGWWEAIHAIRAGKFNLAVDLQGLFRSALLGWLSGAPAHIGFAEAREGSTWLYRYLVQSGNLSLHAVDRYLLIAQSLAAPMEPLSPASFPLPADPDTTARVVALVGNGDGALVAVNPSARWATKQWSPESFAAVADALHKQGVRVALVGAPDDGAVGEQVVRYMQTPPLNLIGKTTLKELIALLRVVRVLVTNDSGPMHLAAAVGTPVVALFGPTDPARTGPYGAGHTILRSGVPCSPCFSRRCTNAIELECLTAIHPEQVAEAVLKRLKLSEVQDCFVALKAPRNDERAVIASEAKQSNSGNRFGGNDAH